MNMKMCLCTERIEQRQEKNKWRSDGGVWGRAMKGIGKEGDGVMGGRAWVERRDEGAVSVLLYSVTIGGRRAPADTSLPSRLLPFPFFFSLHVLLFKYFYTFHFFHWSLFRCLFSFFCELDFSRLDATFLLLLLLIELRSPAE